MTDTPSPTPPLDIAALLSASMRRVVKLEQHCSGVMRDGVFQPRAIQSLDTVPVNGGDSSTMILYWDHDSLAGFITASIELLEELDASISQAERLAVTPLGHVIVAPDTRPTGPVRDEGQLATTSDLGTLGSEPDATGQPGAADQPSLGELT